jgi:hypothetical protein
MTFLHQTQVKYIIPMGAVPIGIQFLKQHKFGENEANLLLFMRKINIIYQYLYVDLQKGPDLSLWPQVSIFFCMAIIYTGQAHP